MSKLKERLKKLSTVDKWQRRAQAINFAVGNVMVDRETTEEQEWEMRIAATKEYDEKHP